MNTWQRPPGVLSAGPRGVPPPPPGHFWDGKPPHEHLYDACEVILAKLDELQERVAAMESRES